MPDDGGRRRPRRVSIPIIEAAVGGIVADPQDVRDRSYEPTLARLDPQLLPSALLLAALRDPKSVWGLPRTQGPEGTCGGQALAALIDIQRINAKIAGGTPASARMIYECARLATGLHAANTEGQDAPAKRATTEGISLRDVIKAFYNYGVCSDKSWPYRPLEPKPGELDVKRAQEAKKISLGAYYRLRPNLNTYHAALHETGAILVSAALHDGWSPDAMRGKAGVIESPEAGAVGVSFGDQKHAFVIIGYTPDGFLVLNSWGPDWGGWKPKAPARAAPMPGVALWKYDDWADRIVDGWVLRLGVGAAEAFDFSIGDQGLGYGREFAVRATPVHTILGNFLHLDDGDFVRAGAYVSTELTLKETRHFLADTKSGKAYRGVLLTFAGGLVGLRDATDHIARQKRLVKLAGWHPFTILWCVDYVEQSRAILDNVLAEAQTRVGSPGPRLDQLIEELAHGVGRAIWRDIEHAAERGAQPGGPMHLLARAGAGIAAARPDFRLRIVAESEGALALAALLAAMRTEAYAAEAGAFFATLDSVDLVAPPLSLDQFSRLAKDLADGWGPGSPRRLRVHLPSAYDEARLAVPPYGRSYFELVARAFRGERDPLREAAALEKEKGKLAGRDPQQPRNRVGPKWHDWAGPNVDLEPIVWPKGHEPAPDGRLDQVRLVYQSDVAARLRSILKGE
jgi:hypothetical protein